MKSELPMTSEHCVYPGARYHMDIVSPVQSHPVNPYDSSVKPGSVFMQPPSQNPSIRYVGA